MLQDATSSNRFPQSTKHRQTPHCRCLKGAQGGANWMPLEDQSVGDSGTTADVTYCDISNIM